MKITERDLAIARRLVREEENKDFQENIIKQVARIIATGMKEEREQYEERIRSLEKDALERKDKQ